MIWGYPHFRKPPYMKLGDPEILSAIPIGSLRIDGFDPVRPRRVQTLWMGYLGCQKRWKTLENNEKNWTSHRNSFSSRRSFDNNSLQIFFTSDLLCEAQFRVETKTAQAPPPQLVQWTPCSVLGSVHMRNPQPWSAPRPSVPLWYFEGPRLLPTHRCGPGAKKYQESTRNSRESAPLLKTVIQKKKAAHL